DVSLQGGTLSGTGTVGTINGTSPTPSPAVGAVSPGDNGAAVTTGVLSSQSVTWGLTTTFNVDLNGTTPGTGHDQLAVTGNIDLGGAHLGGTVGAGVHIGDRFTIITTAGGLVSGHFAEDFGADIAFVGRLKVTVDYSDPTKVVLTRIKNAATVALSSSAPSAVYGQQVLFTATVTPEPGAGAIPTTDTVTFTLDGVAYPPITVDANGSAVFDPQAATGGPLTVGQHRFQVTYSGDGNFNGSATTTDFVLTVGKDASQVTITPSTSSTVFSQPVTFTATVSSVPPGTAQPTGNITFWDGAVNTGTNLGTRTLDANGMATLQISTLGVATHSINVSYTGDTKVAAGTGTLSFAVSRATTSTALASSANPGGLGDPITFTATVTAASPATATPTGSV